MAFNPNQPYATVNSAAGIIYYLQGSTYYRSFDLLALTALPTTNSVATVAGVKQRFLNSLPNGAAYRALHPLLNPPAWVANTQYAPGNCVQNGGNLYLAQSLSGASASSGSGPSGTGPQQIGDGALQWLYMGPVDSVLADQSDAPTVTFGPVNAATTRFYNPVGATDSGAFWITGTSFSYTANAWGSATPALAYLWPNATYVTASMEFCTDAQIISFNAEANFSTALLYNFFINGVPLYRVGCAAAPSALNGVWANGMVLNFTGQPKRQRRFKFNFGNAVMTGLRVAPTDVVWAPVNPNRYRLACEGDSTMDGATPTTGAPGQMRPNRLASMLGCDDVWSFAVGGTGFINPGTGPNGGSTVQIRAQSVIASAPDILYIAPINNDVGNSGLYTSATRTAAYRKYFTTMLAALPNLIIIAGGGYPNGPTALNTDPASAWQVEQDMMSAVAAFNNPRVLFMPSMSAAGGGWLTGNGGTYTTTNTVVGNSNWMIGDGIGDNLHPNQRYLEMVQWREYYALVAAMNTLVV